MIGERTRAALEREKMLALRAIKELEFDHAMGKIAAEDFREMEGRLRARAIRLMRQLDAGAGYRERIERDLAKRLGAGPATGTKTRTDSRTEVEPAAPISAPMEESIAAAVDPQPAAASLAAGPSCARCATANDADAKFCKSCGQSL